MTPSPAHPVCGIDIGSDRVRTVLARAVESSSETEGVLQLEMLAVGEAESRNSVQHGEVVRRGRVTEAVRQTVEEVEQAAGVEVDSAFVSMGSRTVRSMDFSGPMPFPVPRHDVCESDTRWAFMAAVRRDGGAAWLRPPYELLHALPHADELDLTDDPTGWSGKKKEAGVHLVSCPRATRERVEEAVNGAGIRIERMVAAPLAAGYGALAQDDRYREAVVLDIGAMTTHVAVFRRSVLRHSDVMPSGGRAYTNDLADELKISRAHAERAKRRYGVTSVGNVPVDDTSEVQMPGGSHAEQWRRRLAGVLRRRAKRDLTRIRDHLRRVLGGLPGPVVFTGGGANLDGLDEVARLVFRAGVEIRSPRGLIGFLDPVGGPQFATAVGLCRYGVHRRRQGWELPGPA